MKFAGVLPFVVGALAVTRRQAAGIPDALDAITKATTDAGNAVQAFNGDFTNVASTSADILSAISAADAVVKGVDTLTSDQVVALLDPTTRLNAAVKTAIDNTIAQHDALVSACFASEILQALQQQQTQSAALVEDIAAKAGPLSEAVKNGAKPAAADIQRGIDAFADAKACDASTTAPAPEATTSAAAAESSEAPEPAETTAAAESSEAPEPVETTASNKPVQSSEESTATTTSCTTEHHATPAVSTATPAVSTATPAVSTATPAVSTAPAYWTKPAQNTTATWATGMNKPTAYPTKSGNATATTTSPPIQTYTGEASNARIVSFGALLFAAVGVAAF
ncbi:unnamed protein product [Zymoseptoria tritici ST99CH_3D1]|uniref:Cell wall protein n=1 Tax=Zymoseptoria tritici ST99CH_1E4 TaxID=1276532 RepID=A0A2H1FNM7_ZYMTR|nr:unnamed protein product [Zymoseptoria tritici ST99CH_1E4]SMR45092.1 unnamed protein product [Zymoseptoria tritici ST99CH_3D1]